MNGPSVLILTLNEQQNLSGCLDSVAWCDDVVVFDSYSIDNTCEIALQAGARVIQRRFDNYAAQRTAALNEVRYKHDWVLMIDADERVPEELRHEICAVLDHLNGDETLFRVRRKDMFLGKWIRRSSGYPTWFGRLVRVGHVRVEREINEEYVTDGRVCFLNQHLLHFPFNKGIGYWFERHNRYSSMEALALTNEAPSRVRWGGLLSADPAARRKALKQVVYRLPARPVLIFLYLYVARLGILDGKAGLVFCALRCIYEFMINFKLMELRRIKRGLSV